MEKQWNRHHGVINRSFAPGQLFYEKHLKTSEKDGTKNNSEVDM